ncbi:MAG: phosphoribosyl-AMP cyclohydrolase [Pseudomonadales bacterium]|nr:phosphoribosyl-AMP cyclohydrolase [Pseudomonadales bacterium]
MSDPAWLSEVKFSDQGLIPAIAQDATSKRILMVAWMNKDALLETVNTGQAVYWSRSRQKLWRKGEESGHQQTIQEIRLDCDSDVLLLDVIQQGGIACHTGRQSCFFRLLKDHQWHTVDPVLKSPQEIYTSE